MGKYLSHFLIKFQTVAGRGNTKEHTPAACGAGRLKFLGDAEGDQPTSSVAADPLSGLAPGALKILHDKTGDKIADKIADKTP